MRWIPGTNFPNEDGVYVCRLNATKSATTIEFKGGWGTSYLPEMFQYLDESAAAPSMEEIEKQVEENFKGLSEFIKDDDLLYFYKSLIATMVEHYAAPAASIKEDAIGFAEWIQIEGWRHTHAQGWYKLNEDEENNNGFYTTEQLYKIYNPKITTAIYEWSQQQLEEKDKEIEILEAREIAWQNMVRQSEDEIERLKGLIEVSFAAGYNRSLFPKDYPSWQTFKEQNKL